MPDLVKVDTTEFNKALRELVLQVPLATNDIVKNEARLAVLWMAKKTSPNVAKGKIRIEKQARSAWKKGKRTGRVRTFAYRGEERSLDARGLAALVKLQRSHLGHFAAGFLGKGNPLQVKAPAAVMKNLTGTEGIVKIIPRANGLTITVINKTAFIEHYARYKSKVLSLIKSMMFYRQRDIAKKIAGYKRGKGKYRLPKAAK